MLTRSNLHHYQDLIVEFIESHPRCALWVDLGLGKTVSTLTAIADLMDAMDLSRTLVIAPLRVAREVWPQEAAKWDHLKHLTISAMIGTERQRLKALHRKADIHVINVDNLTWLEGRVGGVKNFPWEMVVIDEASGFKDRSSMRFKSMSRMARVADRVVELTATPTPNTLIEAWPQFYLLDNGHRLGPSLTQFKQRYFVQPNPMVNKWVPKKGAREVIEDQIKDITVTLKADDYLQMPEKIMVMNEVVLDDKEMEAYEAFERDFVLGINDTEIEAISASALATKLLQMANGQLYDSERNVHTIHGRKIEMLRELREQANGESLLVAYAFKSDLARLKAEFPDAETLDAPNAIERWNRGEISMLLVHPASAGHGLNLQYGGRHIVWYGLTWSLELYLQLIGRLHRQGQTKPVIVHHIIAKRTIDEIVMRVIESKNVSQEALLQAMKKHVASLVM